MNEAPIPDQQERLFAQLAVADGHISHEQLSECLTLKSSSQEEKALWEVMVEKSYIDLATAKALLDKVQAKKTVAKAKSKVEEFFGDVAVSRGYCTREQMARALAQQKERMQAGHNQRLGELCVELKVLTPEQVADILAEQQRKILVCERCGSAYNVEGFSVGKRWRCRVCNTLLEVPGGPEVVSKPLEELSSEKVEERFQQKTGVEGATLAEVPADKKETRFGNYHIIEKIARGGMGIIYKARQRGLDRIVALKVLIAGEHASEETIERFYLEAKSVAKLRHPNIVPIHEVGIHEGKHFFTMDFIHGESLRFMLLNQKINVHRALEIAAKVSGALDYAHKQGIVHRDIKPENILLDETGEPLVTDFGLAKDVQTDTHLTRAGVVMGTPAYMSPEQARGERASVDHRTDVYSLGTVLYEMLTGEPVFKFEGPIGLNALIKTISEDPAPPRKLNPRIPREVETIVLKTLEKDPDRRYQGAGDFADDIERYLTGEPILARPPSFTYRAWKKIKKYKAVSASVFSALVVMVAMAVYFINERIEADRMREQQIRTYLQQAEECFNAAKYSEAKDFYSKAEALKPGDEALRRQIIRRLASAERLAQQEAAINRAAESAAAGAAMLAEARKIRDAILEEARETTDKVDTDAAKEKYLDAIRLFDKALADYRDNQQARSGKYHAAIELGQLYMEDGLFGVAEFMFSSADGLDIDDSEAQRLVADARAARRKAKEFDDLLANAKQSMGEGEWDEALRHLQQAKESEGISEVELKDVKDLINQVEHSRYFWEGENELKKGNTTAAIQAFLKAESYDKTEKVAGRLKSVKHQKYLAEGSAHFREGEHSKAIEDYEKARNYADNPAEMDKLIEQCRDKGFKHYFDAAMAAKAARDWEEALSALREALALRPQDAQARRLTREITTVVACPEEMTYVFSGKFPIGSAVPDDRNPAREVFVDFFFIDKYEVTNRQFKAFVNAGGYAEAKYWDTEAIAHVPEFTDRTGKPGPATWENGTFPQGKEDFPVTGVCWYEARAYARWAGKRLPREEEWEKAASWDAQAQQKRVYPWGDEWHLDWGNFTEDEPTKVGCFPEDLSPAGCYDMGGNAFEWTDSAYRDKYRVIRSGGVGLNESTLKRFARTTKRKCPNPLYRSVNAGFRCALTPGK